MDSTDLFDFETRINRKGRGSMKQIVEAETSAAFPCTDYVVLAGAEMDFATAPVIREALADFSARGLYGYTLPDDVYLSAVTSWMKTVRGFDVRPEEIVPTHGTIFALGTAVRALTSPGDGVIVSHPSYYRFDNCIRNAGRIVVSNPLKETDGRYDFDFDHLESLMRSPENKLAVLCNPHNPTSRVFGRQDLETLAGLAERHNVVIFSDEIFAEVTFGRHQCVSYASVDPDRALVSTSLGKAFNFTGVNQANLIIPNKDVRGRYLAQRRADHFGSLDPFFYQAVTAGYSGAGAAWIRAMNAHVEKQYNRIDSFFRSELPLFSLSPLEGTFVAWMDCRRLRLSDEELQGKLLKAGLILDPGIDYSPGGSGFMRFNLATTSERTDLFLKRLAEHFSCPALLEARPARPVREEVCSS